VLVHIGYPSGGISRTVLRLHLGQPVRTAS
jgi:hypothetical protein